MLEPCMWRLMPLDRHSQDAMIQLTIADTMERSEAALASASPLIGNLVSARGAETKAAFPFLRFTGVLMVFGHDLGAPPTGLGRVVH